MSTVTIRTADLSDIPRLSELWQEKMVLLNQSDPRFVLATDGRVKWARAAEAWLSDGDCAVFVAEVEDRLLGYMVGWLRFSPPVLDAPFGVISEIALDVHSYTGGLGSKLVQAINAWFRARGVERVVACVPHLSPVEQAFWRANGATQWMDLMWVNG